MVVVSVDVVIVEVVRVVVTVVVVTEVVVTEVVVGGGTLQVSPDHLFVQTQVNALNPSTQVPCPLHGSAVALQSLTGTVHLLPEKPVASQSHPHLFSSIPAKTARARRKSQCIHVRTLAGARATAHNPAWPVDLVAVVHVNVGPLAAVGASAKHYTFFRTFTVRANVGTAARPAFALVVALVAMPAPVVRILAVALTVCASLVRPEA